MGRLQTKVEPDTKIVLTIGEGCAPGDEIVIGLSRYKGGKRRNVVLELPGSAEEKKIEFEKSTGLGN